MPTINNPATTTILPGDTYGLYCLYMMTNGGGIDYNPAAATGAKFSVSPGDRLPARDCMFSGTMRSRFVNWLQNGQGNGSTESGTDKYHRRWATLRHGDHSQRRDLCKLDLAALGAAHRKRVVQGRVLRPEQAGRGGLIGSFRRRATRRLAIVLDPTGTDNANFNSDGLTPVGTLMALPGPYGTFDQGGEIWQWSETAPYAGSSDRLVQGGALGLLGQRLELLLLHRERPLTRRPTSTSEFGFRVAYTQRTVLPG